jgi:hypothetical protein
VFRLGFITKSKPCGIVFCPWRRISRTLLFTRFLSWAFPSFRGVVSPNRLITNPFFRANSTKERETRFAPPSYTFLNSALFLSRKSLGNVLVVFNCDALPAFVSSCLQHKPSTPSFHSLTESMGFRATTIVRLVCPLWHSSTPSKTLNLPHVLDKNQWLSRLKTRNGNATLSRLSRQFEISFPQLWK